MANAFTTSFCPQNHGSILAEKLSLPHLNLGFAGVGAKFFLNHHQLIEQYVNQAQFAIILVMSGRSESNSVLANGGLEICQRRADGNHLSAEEAYRELLEQHDFEYVQQILAETRSNWVKNYQQLLSMIIVVVAAAVVVAAIWVTL